MATELFANAPSTTVSIGGTDAPSSGTGETWTVASSATFPSAILTASGASQFHVADPQRPGEVIAVTAISGTTWTVTRGAEGTTPLAHSPGFTVQQVASAGVLASITDLINVTSPVYGADPTGTNDSTTPIQNALNAAQPGQVVYGPAGLYVTTAHLTVPNGVAWLGSSSSFGMPEGNYGLGGLPLQGTIIQPANSFASPNSGTGVIVMSSASSQGGGQRIQNISIDATNLPNGNNLHGIAIFNAVACVTLRDITVYGKNGQLGGDCLHAVASPSQPPDLINMFSCHWSEAQGYGVYMSGVADSYINSCEATGNKTGGWYIINCNNSRFVGAKGEQSSNGPGWLLQANAGFTGIVHLLACTAQGNNQDGFRITGPGTGTYQIIGCSADSDGANGGSGGGGYAGLNVTSFSGTVLADGFNNRVTGSPAVPQYGVAMTSSNVLNMADAVLAGATSGVFNGGGNTTFNAGTVPGQYLCPPTSYAPGSLGTLSVNSLTFAAFSSANVNTGSFTAPASGSVLVTASFVAVQATGTAACAFALAAHGTVTPLVGNAIQGSPANTTTNQPTTVQFLVTGLTPGTSYNFDLLGATGNTSDALEILALQMTATTITSGNRGGPVVMTVQAV